MTFLTVIGSLAIIVMALALGCSMLSDWFIVAAWVIPGAWCACIAIDPQRIGLFTFTTVFVMVVACRVLNVAEEVARAR